MIRKKMHPQITTRHPFIDGLKNYPLNKEKDLFKIKNWMSSQPHLPTISDEYIYLFLHGCYYSQDRTKHAIENYFSLRTNSPSLFANRDALAPEVQTIMHLGNLVRLPKTTPEGYRVLLFSVKDPDCTKFVFSDAVKAFCMYNDCILSEDGLSEGYIIIFDMEGVNLGHLARVNLPPLRAFMLYIQEAYPARLKGIHILNTANYVHHVMRLVCPMIKADIFGMVHFHPGNRPEGFPIEILPKEYGGEAASIEELDQDTKSLVSKYVQWLRDTEAFKVDETKRIKKQSWWNYLTGSAPASNLTIEQQKEEFMKNLRIE